jgi:hypothetical protein
VKLTTDSRLELVLRMISATNLLSIYDFIALTGINLLFHFTVKIIHSKIK